MKYQHLRHATGILYYGGLKILIDPMLAPKEVNPPIANSWNKLKNPRVDLPIDLSSLEPPEYCLVTHLHSDHFDKYAQQKLSCKTHLLCQPTNLESFISMGFATVTSIDNEATIDSINIYRVPGQHGTGSIAKLMGVSSGYILSAPNEPILYITGDTIFYEEIKNTLNKYRPDVILAFGGGAQFAQGDPITLTCEDILALNNFAPQAKIICVHMDALNHCKITRNNLRQFLSSKLSDTKSYDDFLIPDDGEWIEIK